MDPSSNSLEAELQEVKDRLLHLEAKLDSVFEKKLNQDRFIQIIGVVLVLVGLFIGAAYYLISNAHP